MDLVTYQQPAGGTFPTGGALSPSLVGGSAGQQGPREAVQPPPLEVFKNLTKPRVTWSGLLADPVLSTGWIGWTPTLPSSLDCLTNQTMEYEKEVVVEGWGVKWEERRVDQNILLKNSVVDTLMLWLLNN